MKWIALCCLAAGVQGCALNRAAALNGVTSLAASADYLTTVHGIALGHTETNPFARPFAQAGPVALAVPTVIWGGALMATGQELRRRRVGWWWVPQAVVATAQFMVAGLNVRVIKRGTP